MNNSQIIKPDIESSLSTWLNYLELIHPKTIDMGLERVKSVAEKMDLLNPAPYTFTVAGTNGKGTTCRTLEMILLASGRTVGVYSSPHLIHYTERVRINDQNLSDAKHVEAFNQIEASRGNISLTYFEYSTLAALYLFKQARLDIVILEVGLGGRLDATNIVHQNMSIITTIDIDHIDYLGDNRESIGFEKAGIFKQNGIAIIGEPDIPYSIYEVAKNKNVVLHCINGNPQSDWHYVEETNKTWTFISSNRKITELPLPNVPLGNAATAVAAIVNSDLAISKDAMITGLKKSQLVGRFQILNQRPLTIVDVAHNPHAAIYLKKQLLKLMASNNSQIVRIVIGMLKDKDIKNTLEHLNADFWYCATLSGPRGATANELASFLVKNNHVKLFENVKSAYNSAKKDASKNDIIVVCGSFHTVAEILSLSENE